MSAPRKYRDIDDEWTCKCGLVHLIDVRICPKCRREHDPGDKPYACPACNKRGLGSGVCAHCGAKNSRTKPRKTIEIDAEEDMYDRLTKNVGSRLARGFATLNGWQVD